MERETLIRNSIISDMSEGVMAVRFDGRIELANDAALAILEKTEEELVGSSFVRAFFGRRRTTPLSRAFWTPSTKREDGWRAMCLTAAEEVKNSCVSSPPACVRRRKWPA